MNLKNEFAKWFHPRAPQSYKQWYGKDLAGKLNDIDEAYMASFKKSLFDLNIDNVESEVSKIKYNIENRHDVNDKTFVEYDKKMRNGIPKAILNNYYVVFLENYSNGDASNEHFPEDKTTNYFSYEKDLQNSLLLQAEELFPGYKVFGDNEEGKEYPINGKRIDLLLEHKTENKLLVVELKAGLADSKAFGQISMYIGPLMQKFRDKEISGVIIAGEIDDTLKMAILSNNNIKAMTYKMKLTLETEEK